jgi:phage shock protein E
LSQIKVKHMNINEAINHPEVALVDVRTPMEVQMEPVPGAVNIPLDEIPDRWEEIKDMSRPLVLFCRSGNRSGQALAYLASKGITDGLNGMGASDVLIQLM